LKWTALIDSYFATYELLKKKLSPAAPTIPGTGEKAAAPPLSIGAVMLAGGTAGVAMWSVAIPPDVSLALASQASHLEEMTSLSIKA
jgi:solute carrier family 25 carnitine/acylcarnitine transporter 20/29